jgi:hypothetical protein
MTAISETDFDGLVAKAGLTLTADQKAVLREVYPTLQALIARVSAPMPREAEPALIFQVEQR